MEMLTHNIDAGTEMTASLRCAFNKPVPRLAEGRLLADHNIHTAIDVSDGFIADLHHICAMSGVSARVNIESLPVFPPAVHVFGEKALRMALSGGEDYELVFTGSPADIEEIKKEAACLITVIGEITGDRPGEVLLLDNNGNPIDTSETGWEHYTRR